MEGKVKFFGSFPDDYQNDLITSTELLISIILYAPDLKGKARESQSCLTISQLLLPNSKKRKGKPTISSRHAREREPPVPVYIWLNIHSLTRSQNKY